MPEDLEKAILFFERAVSLDPQYALGYSGLAETYVVIGDHARIVGTLNLVKPQIAYPKAEQYCLKALSIDNELAEAYAALGEVRCDWKWDFPGAEKALKKAIELNPNYATAHQWLAEYYFGLGNIHSAREAIDRARELDPFSFIIQFVNARVHLGERNYYNSIEILNEILTKIPDFQPAHLVIAHAYLLSKSYDLALLHIAKFKNPLSVKYFKCRILAKSGDINQAKKMLQDSLSIPDIYDWPGALAIIYGELGQIDEAVKWYKKAIEKHSQFVLFRHGFGRCDVLNNDPRVKEMLREAGLDR
jgi:tetratricopeptide (TPR) repeat protein